MFLKKLLLVFIVTNDNILIEKSCSTFVGELYHTCGRVISHLWADYKTLVGVCISSEFTSRAVSLMCVITMTQVIVKAPLRVHYGNYCMRGLVETNIQHSLRSCCMLVSTTPRVM